MQQGDNSNSNQILQAEYVLIRSLCVWHPQAQTQTNDKTIVNVDVMPYDINLRKEELSHEYWRQDFGQ